MKSAKHDANGPWFRGATCSFYPKPAELQSTQAVIRHIVNGWQPPEPAITRKTRLVAFGSCFAANITNWLNQRRYRVLSHNDRNAAEAYVVRFSAGMVNSFVLRQQFEWAFENIQPKAATWYLRNTKSFSLDETVRNATRDLFLQADVFIITLGLAEIWYDYDSGEVFWRAVPKFCFDSKKHRFRISTAEENKANIIRIYQLIQKHRPGAKVILTLSPIPLAATFRPVSCISANTISKAVLRVAIDEAMQDIDAPDTLFYWPSYEVLIEGFSNQWGPGGRHIKPPLLDFVMTLFEAVWCKGTEPRMSLAEAWLSARTACGDIPDAAERALKSDDPIPLARLLFGGARKRRYQDIVIEAAMGYAKRCPDSAIANWLEKDGIDAAACQH